METLDYIVKKFKLDLTQPSPIPLSIGRFKDVPRLFRELGFKVGAEVGVFEGEYSKWLLRMIPGLKLFGIDAWQPYGGYKDYKDNTITNAFAKAQANVKGYDCNLITGWSNEVYKQFDDESLDFVFIDGNHSYEWCVWDIANWSKKVRKGGIVYGHDYDDYSNKRRWHEMAVIPAVNGWMEAYKIKPWFITTYNKNKCWMYVKE